jgi:hypothetical protein
VQTYEVEKKIPLPLTKDNVIGAMIYKHPYVWLGTNNAVIRVLAEEERVIDVQGGHTKLINQFISVEDEIWSCSSDSCICVWDDQV